MHSHILPILPCRPSTRLRKIFDRCLRRTLLAGAALLACAGGADAQIFSNPGFESDFSGWTTSQGNGSASFVATTTSPYVGTKSALITVSSPGATFPSLSATFTASSSQTYLLRYFAKAATNRPTMKIHISSASGPVYSAFTFNPSSNGWEEYHVPFKASGATTVQFTFEQAAAYSLDELQVYDTNSPADHTGTIMDPVTSFMWHWGQTPGTAGGLMNTDNNISVPLPDGRVAWIFNDTYTGTTNPYNNSAGTTQFRRNYMLIQNGTTLTPWVIGQNVFTPANTANWYWPTDAFVEGSKLKVLMPEISSSGDVGVVFATFSLPGLTLDGMSTGYLPWAVGKVLDGGDGYFYLYNQKQVGRVAKGSFNTTSSWRFWDGSTWNTSSAAAVDLPNFNAATALERLGPNNYVETYTTFVGATMRARFAPTPQGPWDATETVIGTPAWEASTSYYYMPYIHKETGQNGVYSVGYCDIGPSAADGDGTYLSNRPGKDQCFYNIEFFRTPNLLNISSYTTDSFYDNFTDNDPTGWQTYGGTWTASGGKYSVTSGAGNLAVLKGIVSGNVTLEADVTAASGGDAGLIFRASNYAVGTNSYNGYYVGLVPGTGVELGMSNGSFHQLALTNMTIAAGIAYPVRVVTSGASIQVFVGNMVTPVISASDSTYASGGVGIRAHNSATTWDNFSVNTGMSHAGQQAETEDLSATATSGVTHRVFAWTSFSGGEGTILDATATGQQVTYTIPSIGNGTYDVKVGVKKAATRGTWQLAAASTANPVFSNIGTVQDEYNASEAFAEYDLGSWSPSSSTDKLFRFTVMGKNASSSGYSISFDYIKLTPQ